MISKIVLLLCFVGVQHALAGAGKEIDELFLGDLLAWEAPEYIQKNFPYYLASYVDGTPLWVFPFGDWELNEQIGKDREVISKWVDQLWHRIRKSGREDGADGFLMIFDVKGFSKSKNGDVDFIKEKMEMVGKMLTKKDFKQGFLIQGGPVWDQYWEMGKGTLGEIESQCQNFPNANTEWKGVLKEWIPDKDLPTTYGGSLETPKKIYG